MILQCDIEKFPGDTAYKTIFDIINRAYIRNEHFLQYYKINKIEDYMGNALKQVVGYRADGNSMRSIYNENEWLAEQIDGLGNTTKMTYDEYEYMNQTTHPDGTEEQVFFNERSYPKTGERTFDEYVKNNANP